MYNVKVYTIEEIKEILDDAFYTSHVFKRKDGSMFFPVLMKPNIPWYVFEREQLACGYWSHIIDMPQLGMGQSFIPLCCQNCWKVVVRPKTVKQLFGMLKIQERWPKSCKSGIEARHIVGAAYGSYFYNQSLEEGLECYENIRMLIDRTLGSDIKVFLKRGCTEYEMGHGDSRLWEPFEGQAEIEKYISDNVEGVRMDDGQTEDIRAIIKNNWLIHAYTIGDESYLELTGGKPLYPPYVTYQHLLGKTAEEIKTWWEEPK